VVADDGPLPVTSRRQRALLCRLLVDPNRVVPRDALLDAMWDERPPATAGKALQVQVHALRRLLGRDRVTTAPVGYGLRVEPGELDAERLELALRDGRARLAAGDAEGAAETLRRALALWRGRPLEDVAYHRFAGAEIARLEELRDAATEERVEAELALGRHGELVPELEALVGTSPLRERLQAQLVLALYRCGRQLDALDAHRRARERLRDEAGLEPGPALRALQRAILEQDAALEGETPEVRARRHLPAPATPLVGRDEVFADVV
jgi:DNA-binding SARP family transcriptional activator